MGSFLNSDSGGLMLGKSKKIGTSVVIQGISMT